ncbi:MAG: hypothetical protein RL518_2486 [Pseudomonadota bacterium]|jgi:hypothetical protein
MDWKVPFVVYRITSEGKLEEVFLAEDFKAASYWLSYIAQPGDVLCKTPLHKKHSHTSSRAEYWSHKGAARELVTDEETWKKTACPQSFQGEFPEEQQKEQI